MKIYTRTGDKGTTQLFGGNRVSKDTARIEACGAVDETIAAIAVAITHGLPEEQGNMLTRVLNRLFALNAMLADPNGAPSHISPITQKDIDELEHWIDEIQKNLEPLKQFILPGGTSVAAELHLARTVARRAERRIVSLHKKEKQDIAILQYMNRISDFLFVTAREANRMSGGDIPASFDRSGEETHSG